MIEPLETRFVPAAVFTFTDVDGDLVKITSSLGTNADLAAAATVVGGQLRLLDLTAAIFQNTDLTAAVVTKSATGDGLVNIGRINASGFDLGLVSVSGDLGNIDCGDANYSTAALKSLSVRSFGVYGLATQGGAGDLESNITGSLGRLTVRRDIVGANIYVNGSDEGTLGSAFVGGSIVGGALPNSGQIQTTGTMGPVTITGDIVGGTGSLSGTIYAGGKLTSITVGGSLVGGTQTSSGSILGGEIGAANIAGDVVGGGDFFAGSIRGGKIGNVNVRGSLLGGAGHGSGSIVSQADLGAVSVGENVKGNGEESGRISAAGSIASVRIDGSLLGGGALGSGSIVSGGALGAVKILHDVKGGAGNESGKIDASGSIGSVTIGGSILGGSGHQDTVIVGTVGHRGQIFSGGKLGPVKIGGNVHGGEGRSTASLVSYGAMTGVSIGGSLLGGFGGYSANVFTADVSQIGPVTIGHDMRGGEGFGSARVASNGDLVSVTIGGSLFGGAGGASGVIGTDGPSTAVVKVSHDVGGGSGDDSGVIGGAIDVSIGGSLIGGTGQRSGGISTYSANLQSVRINHDLLGGSIPGQHAALDKSGFIESELAIGSIFIGGSIISGTDGSGGAEGLTFNASIRAGRNIGSLTVRGDIVGNVSPAGDSPVIISAFGQESVGGATSDIAIGRITVGGRVEWAQIFAGYDRQLVGKNADAQIGSVAVGRDWIASSIIAGAVNLGDDLTPGGMGADADNVNFGDIADRKITEAGELTNVVSRIGSITIAGRVFGTPDTFRPLDQFGFVAEEIGALKVGVRTFVLTAGAENDGAPVNWRTDVLGTGPNFHEIGGAIGYSVAINGSAKLVNPSTVTYFDKDGDKVTVTFSQPLLTAGNVNDVFHFDTGKVNDGFSAAQQLRYLDLRALVANRIGVTFTVVRSNTGDGLVHVGAIESTGYDVGTVSIPGDLGQIDAGDAVLTTPGLATLNVRTLGRLGLDSQGPQTATFTPNLESRIAGKLSALNVRQDIAGAFVNVNGEIGAVKIGGSLVGGEADHSGEIKAAGKIGAVQIGHHLQGGFGESSGAVTSGSISGIASMKIGGSVLGAIGAGSGSTFGGVTGAVQIGHNVRGGTNDNTGTLGVEQGGSVTIGGSLIGGLGGFGARIVSDSAIGAVKIAHNVLGGADRTARIEGGSIAGLTIGGSLVGGFGTTSGSITAGGKIGPVTIAHDVQGGGGSDSGGIYAEGGLATVKIGGSLVGGKGTGSGYVESRADAAAVQIGGDALGGEGSSSGLVITTGKLNAVTVHGSLLGGSGITSGTIISGAKMGSVTIGGNLLGGDESASGYLYSPDDLGNLKLGGSLVAGAKNSTGYIDIRGQAGAVKIGGDVIGGNSSSSGALFIGQKLKKLGVDGSLAGGTKASTGAILAGEIGTAKIGRNILGGSIVGPAATLDQSGYIESDHRIASLTVGGSLFAGWDTATAGSLTRNASIRADRDIAALVVRGSLHGHATSEGLSPVVISASGNPIPVGNINVAIGSLRVGGSVERASIFGGYASDLTPATTVAQVGNVAVGRDWIASNLVVGVQNLGADDNPGGVGANADNVNFGDAHDTFIGLGNIANRIAKITIGGIVAGTEASGDHFGFSSVNIGSFKSLNFTAPLTPAENVIDLSPTTGDVAFREA